MTFSAPGDDASALAGRIQDIIHSRQANSPRSKQKAIGLSEVGDVCPRKLAYKTLDWTATSPASDPWASISGTAIHAWLADAFLEYPDRFLVEHPVRINDELAGTCDLFDRQEQMVIDHKCVGATSMKNRKRNGMTDQQRVQINLYAYGLELAGEKVSKVAIAYYPLGGRLDGLHTIVEPYRKDLAIAAIERLENIKVLIWQLDPEKNQDHWNLIPATPSSMCIYCPFYLPNSTNLAIS